MCRKDRPRGYVVTIITCNDVVGVRSDWQNAGPSLGLRWGAGTVVERVPSARWCSVGVTVKWWRRPPASGLLEGAVVCRERCWRGAAAVGSNLHCRIGLLNMSGKQVNCDVGKWDQPLRMSKCFLGRRGLPNNFFDCNIISKFRQFQQLTFDMSKLEQFWGDELIWSKNIVNSGVCTSIRVRRLITVNKEFARWQKRWLKSSLS